MDVDRERLDDASAFRMCGLHTFLIHVVVELSIQEWASDSMQGADRNKLLRDSSEALLNFQLTCAQGMVLVARNP